MQARVDRARALIKSGKQKEAIPDLLMAEKESPDEPSIHFLCRQRLQGAGRRPKRRKRCVSTADLQRQASQAVAGQASDAISIKSTSH